jgi:hypothetical protein
VNALAGVSLLELLRFYAESYVSLAKDLLDLQVCLQLDKSDSGEKTEVRHIRTSIEVAIVQCRLIGLQVSALHAEELLAKLGRESLTDADVKALHENIERELSCQFFVGIPVSRVGSYTNSLIGWEEIADKFPFATEDIEEMNKCYALCRYSASAFHSLLVVEHGLVALGKLIGVTDPKEGWDASCRKLKEIVDAGRNHNTTSLDFSFLEQLNSSAQAMKFAWRNKVNHATGKVIVMGGGFASHVTEEIIVATRSFMRRLLEGMP